MRFAVSKSQMTYRGNVIFLGKSTRRNRSKQAAEQVVIWPDHSPQPTGKLLFLAGLLRQRRRQHHYEKKPVSVDESLGNTSGERDLNKPGQMAISSATSKFRCRVCDMKYDDEHGLTAHKKGRTHKRAVRLARKGARSVLTYLALGASSSACPPFESVNAIADVNEDESRNIAWLCEGHPGMLEALYDLRQLNSDKDLDHRWNCFLAAVALGYDAMVKYEKDAEKSGRGWYPDPRHTPDEIWIDEVLYGVDIVGPDNDVGDIPNIDEL